MWSGCSKTHAQHLLLAHHRHIPPVGRRSPVFLWDMADAVVKDFCVIGRRSTGLRELDICYLVLVEVKGGHGDQTSVAAIRILKSQKTKQMTGKV